ncbi:putative reverse transcriptase domain-containing protein, partial [Tanacetum coccineum]
EVDHREISLRDDAIVKVSNEPHLEQDMDPEIQAEIDECIAYADALRDRGIDARGHRIVGVESAVIALTERIVELERDNKRLGGTMSVENLRRVLGSTWATVLRDVTPTTLDTSYAVELADGRISETNIVLRGCTLGLLGHPFDIDLMPVELGSFNVIIGMDWLAKYHALIVCDEKVVRVPYGNEVLII